MTAALTLAAIAAAFVIGFLLGDRRACANAMKSSTSIANTLLKAMMEGGLP